MDIIVRGEPHEIDFVRCICRDKVRRGVISILPATGPASDDVVVKLRNERDETAKENDRLKERVAELESLLGNVASNVATSADNVASSICNVESLPESTDAVDNKYIDNDNLQEIDLDADDKTLIEDDSKNVAAVDTKKTSTAREISRCSKKSE